MLSTLLLVFTAQSEVPTNSPTWPEFTQALVGYAAADGVLGGAAIMMEDGRIVQHHEFGVADRDLERPVTAETIFHWASITKTLTGIAVMQLRDRGLVSLDDTVTHYVPELRRVHDPYGAMEAITVRMLLSHSAGFMAPTWPYGSGAAWEPFEPTEWEQLVAMMPYQELRFPPGSRYGYSNPAFIYLARIIELQTGDPWATYVQNNIFSPLGLTQSYFGTTPPQLQAWRSNGYTIWRDSAGVEVAVPRGPDFDPGITIPNSGWNAPLADLATYAAFLTGSPEQESPRYDLVLSRGTLEEMWQPVVPHDADNPDEGYAGLAFQGYTVDGRTVVGHTGDQAGFRSMLYFDPMTGRAVIAVINTTNATRAESDAGWDALSATARGLAAGH